MDFITISYNAQLFFTNSSMLDCKRLRSRTIKLFLHASARYLSKLFPKQSFYNFSCSSLQVVVEMFDWNAKVSEL